MRRFFVWLIALGLSVAASPAAWCFNVFFAGRPADPRRDFGGSFYELPVGRLIGVDGDWCSFFLVSAEYALSSAHCVMKPGSTPIRFVRLEFGRNGKTVQAERAGEVARVSWAYWHNQNRPGDDWVLIHLKTPVEITRYHPLPLCRVEQEDYGSRRIGLVAYHMDWGNRLVPSEEFGCTVSPADSYRRLRHSCSNQKGSSGAPLLKQLDGGRFCAVGINQGTVTTYMQKGIEYSDEVANTAVASDVVIDEIQGQGSPFTVVR